MPVPVLRQCFLGRRSRCWQVQRFPSRLDKGATSGSGYGHRSLGGYPEIEDARCPAGRGLRCLQTASLSAGAAFSRGDFWRLV
eukprot:s1875_g2.t1